MGRAVMQRYPDDGDICQVARLALALGESEAADAAYLAAWQAYAGVDPVPGEAAR